MDDCSPPEWVVALENKKKHKLAHDIGAGAPCLNCLDRCLGLDLHFWRKLCRNCKCKKEAHDIKEEDSFQQIEILFGENALKNKEGMRKFAEDLASKLKNGPHIRKFMELLAKNEKENTIKFDWLPVNVPLNLASEYLQQLPLDKLPISGSEGAIFRRQQLEKQMPLHDFNVNNCHDLSSEETKAFTNYVENVKTSVVGQGQIAKIPLVSECRYPEDTNSVLLTNRSSDHYTPSFSKNLNVTPKPFKPFVQNKNNATNVIVDDSLLLPDLLQPTSDLKPPSAFIKNIKTNAPNYENRTISSGVSNSSCVDVVPSASIGLADAISTDVYEDFNNKQRFPNHGKNVVVSTSAADGASKYVDINRVVKENKYPSNFDSSNKDSCKENVAPESSARQALRNHHYPVSMKVDDRLCSVRNPAQFHVVSSPLQSKPNAGDVFIPRHNRDNNSNNNEIIEPMNNNTKSKVHFGDATFIEDVEELTDQMGSLSAPSLENLSKCVYCHHCKETISPGQLAVQAEKSGLEFIWHPNCFVCNTCEELLVDLIYFFHKDEVYCGRHYAEVVNIPRCYACDELIFVKEYTVAEGQSFHVKHFCCFECDTPLADMQYVPKDDHPVCLPCYNIKYGKKCHCCHNIIEASSPRLGFKHLNWHATATCFKCFQCSKSLLGGQFAVRDDQPFCSKECVQQFKQR